MRSKTGRRGGPSRVYSRNPVTLPKATSRVPELPKPVLSELRWRLLKCAQPLRPHSELVCIHAEILSQNAAASGSNPPECVFQEDCRCRRRACGSGFQAAKYLHAQTA